MSSSPASVGAATDRARESALQFMRLVWSIDHQLERVSKRMESRLGLTVPQRMTLLLIGRTPGTNAQALAALLHLHPGTLSGIVRRLARAGLIDRTGDDDDARSIRLTLTQAGRAANRRRSGTFEDAMRRVLARTTRSEQAAAGRLLARLADELKAIAGP